MTEPSVHPMAARNRDRYSGVLLHITSLPGPHGSGDLGSSAHHFVDWLTAARQTLWQFLPLGGIGLGNSPYMSSSAFAGNPLLIDLTELRDHGWLDDADLTPPPGLPEDRVDFARVVPFRMERLRMAAARFAQGADAEARADLAAFRARHAGWLEDYALFMSLADRFAQRAWAEWDAPLARRDAAALQQAERDCAGDIAFWIFVQWCFFRQWHRLRQYANANGVELIGDVPVYVAQQSADVWARPELFQLDEHLQPAAVSGVPPDAFSATGQRWGNPLYRWPMHEAEGFQWWIERFRLQFELADRVRVDHFRGFESYWEIPASEPLAIHGRWVPAPGDALFAALKAALGDVPVIAEDLGVITPEVTALRRRAGLPGMRVLQFAWGEDAGNDGRYLPHNYDHDAAVYTGTHDNDTTVGWWHAAPDPIRHHLRDYLATDGGDIAWTLIRAACASVADLAVFPMQDVLRGDSAHRMNRPGVADGNWGWRFSWRDVMPGHAELLARYSALYGRHGRQHV